jgi:hypothetical protein
MTPVALMSGDNRADSNPFAATIARATTSSRLTATPSPIACRSRSRQFCIKRVMCGSSSREPLRDRTAATSALTEGSSR